MSVNKEEISSNKKIISIEYICIVFVALMILAVIFMPNAFAKFNDAGSFGDGARIAKWSVNVTDDASTKDIVLKSDKKTGEFKFETHNNRKIGVDTVVNETACKYKIRVILPEGTEDLPEKITMTLTYNNGNRDVIILPSNSSNKSIDPSHSDPKEYIFESEDFRFGPAEEKSQPMSLTFTMQDGCSKTTIEGIQVFADFEQLD